MSFTIIQSDGTTVYATIADGTANTRSGISLPGNYYANYGRMVDTTIVHMLEHFASTIPPGPQPLTGQLWYDTMAGTMMVYNGAAWTNLAAGGGGGGTPGGANTDVQFNDSGVFGGKNNFTFNKNTNTLRVPNLSLPGGSIGQVLSTDGLGNLSWISVGGSVGGSNTQVQFNDGGGALGGVNNFTFNKTTNLLTAPNVAVTGNLTAANVQFGNSNLGSNSNVKISGGGNGQVLTTDGLGNLSWTTVSGGGGGTPGGPNASIQFNNAGAFGGSANLTYVPTGGNPERLISSMDIQCIGSNLSVVSGRFNVQGTSTFQGNTTIQGNLVQQGNVGIQANSVSITGPGGSTVAIQGNFYVSDLIQSSNALITTNIFRGNTFTPTSVQGNFALSRGNTFQASQLINGTSVIESTNPGGSSAEFRLKSIIGSDSLSTGGNFVLYTDNPVDPAPTVRGVFINQRGTTNVWSVRASDARLKDVLLGLPVTSGMQAIQRIGRPVQWRWRNSDDDEYTWGYTAQQVGQGIPQAVIKSPPNPDGSQATIPETGDPVLTIDATKHQMVRDLALVELVEQNALLVERIQALEHSVARLAARLP